MTIYRRLLMRLLAATTLALGLWGAESRADLSDFALTLTSSTPGPVCIGKPIVFTAALTCQGMTPDPTRTVDLTVSGGGVMSMTSGTNGASISVMPTAGGVVTATASITIPGCGTLSAMTDVTAVEVIFSGGACLPEGWCVFVTAEIIPASEAGSVSFCASGSVAIDSMSGTSMKTFLMSGQSLGPGLLEAKVGGCVCSSIGFTVSPLSASSPPGVPACPGGQQGVPVGAPFCHSCTNNVGNGPGCGPSPASQATGADRNQILIHNGEEAYTVTDLSIPGRGIPWTHTRVYRSQRETDTSMGHGWTHSLLDILFLNTDGSIRSYAGTAPFDTARHDDWEPAPGNANRFLAPKAVFSNLTRLDNGTPGDPDDDSFLLVDREGSRRRYNVATPSFAVLSVIEDRYGNQLKLFYEDVARPTLLTRVNDTLGRDIVYAYYDVDDPNVGRRNRIATITDFFGRVLSYDYDSEGNLIEAISPTVTGTVTNNNFPAGKKETYTYSTGFGDIRLDHNLLSVTRANENDSTHGLPADGTPALEWTYDSDDRVTTHTVGVTAGPGSVGGTITYVYEENPAAPADFDASKEDVAVLKITETDRNMNVRAYWLDDFGAMTRFEHFTKGLRPGEPVKYLQRFKLNAESLNDNVNMPEGNDWTMDFDMSNPDPRQQGNLQCKVFMPDARGGDQVTREWRYVYDPFYNQPCLIIDPRAFDGGFVPPNGGAVTPLRYSTQYLFDYQEGPDTDAHKQRLADRFGLTLAETKDIIDFNEAQVEAALGLAAGSFTLLGRGDLNGDGRTDLINGDHVLLIEPSVNLIPGSNQAVKEGSTVQAVITAFAYDDHGLKLYEIDSVGNVTDFLYFSAADPNGDGSSTEVTDPRGGNGYLRGVLRDDRELPSVTPRLATADGIGFASLLTEYTRDVVGNTTSMTDPRGNTWSYTINELNQAIRTTEPAPYAWTRDTIFDANNNVIERRIQNLVPSLVDGKPQLDVDGNLTLQPGTPTEFINTFEYDILDNLITEDIDATGSTPSRLITTYRYDGNENRDLVTKPEGNEDATVYDERDLVFTETRGFGSPDASTSTYNYDDNRNLVEMVDAEDNNGDAVNESTLYEYDGYDRLKRVIDAVGNVRETTYDGVDNLIQEDFRGVVGGPSPTNNSGVGNVLLSQTLFQHDELNRVYQTDRFLGVAAGTPLNRVPTLVDGALSPADSFVSSRTEFDARSRVSFTVEDDLDASEFVYDGVNRRVKSIDAENNVVDTVYDENDNVIQTVELDRSQLGTVADETITTNNTYDVINRLTVTVDNVGNTDRFAYDSRNNQTDHQDAEDNTRHMVYDGANRKIAEHTDMRVDGTGGTAIDPGQSGDGFISVFTAWDGNSRLLALTDDNGNRTIYGYDDLDRKTDCTYGDVVTPALADRQDPTTSESWTYDRDHNVVSYTDQNGSTFDCDFDAINRKVRCDISFAPGNPHNLTGTTLQTMQYDGLSRKTQCTDNNNPGDPDDDLFCTAGYDTLSRMVEGACRIGALPLRVTSYNYDESLARAGNLQATSMIYPDGREVEMGYDDINRLNTANDIGASAIFNYDYIGRTPRVLRKLLQNATMRTQSYDGIRRPLNLTTVDGGSALVAGFEHAYDREDNKRFERKLHDTGNSELYDYDSAYRLVDFQRGILNATGTAVTTPTTLTDALQNRNWTLDGVGNWDRNVRGIEGIGMPIDRIRQDTNFNELIEELDANGGGTTVLEAIADTYVRREKPNTNEGGSDFIRLRKQGRNRGIVRFDQTAIDNAVGTGTLLSAKLEFTIQQTGNNWGASGRKIGVHRMKSDWAEGNGFVGGQPPGQKDRGTGQGATWNCAIDGNITNFQPDCLLEWEMDRFRPTDFAIHDDHVVPNFDYTMTVEVLGTQITTSGGSPLPVTTRFNFGGAVEEPFGPFGQAVDGNINDGMNPRSFTSMEYTAGTPFTMKGRSWVKKHPGLSGSQNNHWKPLITVNTAYPSPQVFALRDGDPVPNIPPFQNQDDIADFLVDHIDGNNKIDIEDNQAICLFELGTTHLGSSAADFQDLVVLLTLDPAQPTQLPFKKSATDKEKITNGQTGIVQFDVTADVEKFLDGSKVNYGWLVKKCREKKNGTIKFDSREGGMAPRLVLEVMGGGGGGPSTVANYDHDDNGNLSTDGSFDYQWDALNRLKTVTRTSDSMVVARMTYDCDNRRMRKAISNSGAADGTTDYYYSNWQVVEEYDLVGASETLKFQYVWGGVYHDELICRDTRTGGVTVAQLNDGSGQERQFQHGNSLFSVFAVTDESGTVLERYQYDPYGNPTVLTPGGAVLAASTIGQEFLYTGQRLDEEFELYYYKNRYYSTEQGRFISRDPIGYLAGMNLYQYVKGRSTAYFDPLGLKDIMDQNVTDAIQVKVQPCIAMHVANLTTKACSLAKPLCQTRTVSDPYICYAFMYNTAAAIVGGVNVSCTTTVTCKWGCCEKRKLWSFDITRCSFRDPIDVNIGIGTIYGGVTYIGSWIQ